MIGGKGEMILAHLLQEWHAHEWRWDDLREWEEGIVACIDAVVSMFEYEHIYFLGTAWISAGAFEWELVTEPRDELSRTLYEVGCAFVEAIRPDDSTQDDDLIGGDRPETIDRIIVEKLWN